MGKARNIVVDGAHKGKHISVDIRDNLVINESFTKMITINSATCKEYMLLTEDVTKSASSAITRGLVGGAFLGGVGLLAGLSAKNVGVYNVILTYRDDTQDLIEIDESYYKKLVASIGLLNTNNNAFNLANKEKEDLSSVAMFSGDVEYQKLSASHHGTLFLTHNAVSFVSHDGNVKETIELNRISGITTLLGNLNINCGLKTYTFKTAQAKEWKQKINR